MLRFLPDLGEIQPPGPHRKIFGCDGFFPTNRGGMARSFGATATAYTTAASGIVTGAAIVSKSDGTHRLFAGSNLKLEEADGAGAWTNRSSATYTTSTGWSFAQFGDDTIAVNGVNNPQISSTGAFASLSGSPPVAKIAVVQSNIVLLFNINDGTARPDWWASSDQNDPRTWTAANTNYADKDRLYGGVGGPITAATVWQEEVIAFKRNAMYAGRFTRDIDKPWNWRLVNSSIGCPSMFGHILTEVGLVFVTERDVMLYDGSPPRSIADDVRKTLFASIGANADTVQLSLDETNNTVWIWFTRSGSSVIDTAYFWNWKTGFWGAGNTFGGKAPSSTVRDASYSAFSESPLSGGTNSAGIANLIFDNADAKLYNMRGALTDAATLTLWEQGNYAVDSRLNKTRAVFVLNNKPTAATLTITPYDAALVSGTAFASTMQSDFSFGSAMSARYFGNVFSIAAGQNCELLDLIPEYPSAAGAR